MQLFQLIIKGLVKAESYDHRRAYGENWKSCLKVMYDDDAVVADVLDSDSEGPEQNEL